MPRILVLQMIHLMASEEQRLEKDSGQIADGPKYEEGRELSPNQGVTKYGNSEINPLEELVAKQPIPEQTYVPEMFVKMTEAPIKYS